jgi:hypothetical protein
MGSGSYPGCKEEVPPTSIPGQVEGVLFSKAHDSWEPLTHINANNQIKEFYQENPTTICTAHKGSPTPSNPITIHSIRIMSTTSSPVHASLTNSPLPIHPPLSERISDPPSPLTLRECLGITDKEVDNSGVEVLHPDIAHELYEHRGTPDPNPVNIPLPSMSPAPMGLQVPPGYSLYNELDFNHSNYGRCITLQPFGMPLSPNYINFEHNFARTNTTPIVTIMPRRALMHWL